MQEQNLEAEIEHLFQQQRETWPRLAAGVAGLACAKTRAVRVGSFDVFVRHIPHRIGSTTAAVDPSSIEKRPCFLCAENLDPEEKGIDCGNEFTVYCNPFPIVERHITIVHREHRPQQIAGQLSNFLEIARALPGYFIIYNGPECGASAPDHLHFQAGSRALFPIENDLRDVSGPAVAGYERNLFMFSGSERDLLIETISRTISLLSAVTGKVPEPLINIAGFYSPQAGWTVYLFPRGKHRPEVFYSGELTVSPASIDLCGIFVVPLDSDFEHISGGAIAAIFREVTLPESQFNTVANQLETCP